MQEIQAFLQFAGLGMARSRIDTGSFAYKRRARRVHDLAQSGTRGTVNVAVTEVAPVQELDHPLQVKRHAFAVGSASPLR
jgi:hypothetical protein